MEERKQENEAVKTDKTEEKCEKSKSDKAVPKKM